MPDEQDPAETTPPATPPPPPSAGTTHTFTQEQLDALLGQKAAQAQRSSTNKLLEEFGFANKAEADKFIKDMREQQRAQMTEAERATAEAKDAKAAADKALADIATERHTTAVERALIVAGAPVDKAARMVSMVTVDQGSDAAAITAAVEACKGDFPALFGSTSPRPPGSEPAGGGPPGSRTTQPNSWDKGRERAEARKATLAPREFKP